MATSNSHTNRSTSSARLLGRRLGLATALALTTAGVATAATVHAAEPQSVTGGVAAPAATAAAAPNSGVGFLPGTTVNASPRITSGGGKVTVTGEAPLSAHAGEWIALVSNAFVSNAKLDGLPAIRTQVLVNGQYSVTATVRQGLKQIPYVIAGRYNGVPFQTATWIRVVPYSTVQASPHAVSGGQQVTVTGNAPINAHAGVWITLMSDAFASSRTVNGIPAIRTQVLVNGKYSTTATISKGLKPTTYAIAGSYNGQPLETVAWISVS